MKVLFVSSEVAPYAKTGGLADVSESLPKALVARGHEVWVVTPLYGGTPTSSLRSETEVTLKFPFGAVRAGLKWEVPQPGLRVVFIDQPEFFQRRGLYGEGEGDYSDNALRFGFFSVAALTAAQVLGFVPDIVHLNDWQTGLAAAALSRGYRTGSLGAARSVFTIHNLAYQGTFEPQVLDALGIPTSLFTAQGMEFYGKASFLKAGLSFSDALTTVSPRYAQEILTPEGGQGLDGFLRTRASALHGILNGIDPAQWNPATDPHLPARYSERDLSGKQRCKHELLARLGLPAHQRSEAPLFAVVSRLAEQKGIELLLGALVRMMEADLTLVVLGSGEARLERALREAHERHPTRVGLKIGFDSALAHLVEAGADFFLMPSLYEPCGLNQLYSLRYGTVPVVRATGGLDDTVVDLSQPRGTGVKFPDFSASSLWAGIQRALRLYEDRRKLTEVRKRGMACDFSWARSAQQYESLYRSILF